MLLKCKSRQYTVLVWIQFQLYAAFKWDYFRKNCHMRLSFHYLEWAGSEFFSCRNFSCLVPQGLPLFAVHNTKQDMTIAFCLGLCWMSYLHSQDVGFHEIGRSLKINVLFLVLTNLFSLNIQELWKCQGMIIEWSLQVAFALFCTSPLPKHSYHSWVYHWGSVTGLSLPDAEPLGWGVMEIPPSETVVTIVNNT